MAVFVSRNESSDRLLDGQLFHGDMTVLFLMDVEGQIILDYIEHVIATTMDLKPAVIYFRQDDVGQAIRAICRVRGRKWDDRSGSGNLNREISGIAA